MTTGPEPRIRTEAGFGPGAVMPAGMASSTAHPMTAAGTTRSSGDEPVEHSERVQRTGRALGVVLDRLDRLLAVAQPLDRSVVEVHLADVETRGRRQGPADDLDLVILGRHLHDPELDVLDRVIRTVVPEPQTRC